MNLLLITEHDQIENNTLHITGRRAEHIYCVIRAKAGDKLRAGMLNGRLGTATVLEAAKKEVTVQLDDFPIPPPAQVDFIPVIALPRPQSFKKTLHFIASSGIRKAIFTSADKVEKSYWKSSAMTPEAIEEELLLGLEQGGTTLMPELLFRPSLKHYMASEEFKDLTSDALCLIAHPRDAEKCPAQVTGRVVCAIGPEGGYREEEVTAFIQAGFKSVEIGQYIFRVEFALSTLYGRLVPF